MIEHDSTSRTALPSEDPSAPHKPPPRQGRTSWRVLRFGCLGIFLLICSLISGIAIALQSGPVNMNLPFSNTLKIGSDNFVLSNYSFQDGNTYYLDLNGSGVRNILQLEYLEDTRSLQVVLHYSAKGDREENQLLQLKLP
jgi:hypothetical protein